MITKTEATGRQEFQHIGHTLAVHVGRVIVALTWVRDSVYRVELHHAGPLGPCGLIDAASYADEQHTRDEALRIVEAYRSGRTVEQVQEAFIAAQDTVWASEARYNNVSRARLTEARRTLDQLRPLSVQQEQHDLVQRFCAPLAA